MLDLSHVLVLRNHQSDAHHEEIHSARASVQMSPPRPEERPIELCENI